VIDAKHYPAQVFWSDDDNGFIALAPDLPGCSAFGETRGEALTELDDAIEHGLRRRRTQAIQSRIRPGCLRSANLRQLP
jgi:predicted RNase H-like HicB family nuclease